MLNRFLADARGNVAPILGLALIPIFGLVGLAIDYGRANAVKADIQAALDATALGLSKEVETIAEKDLTDRATAYFKAVLNRPEIVMTDLTPVFVKNGSSFELTITGAAHVPGTLSRVLGQDHFAVGGFAQVKWGIKRLEVALALDNTGSMAWNSKITHLKTAVHSLLDTLKTAATTADSVKVAIVPFDTTVNIGTSYKDQPWFDYDSIDCNGSARGKGCTSTTWKNHWDGCVRDRSYPYDVQDDAPGSKAGTLYPAFDCGSLARALPLTRDWTALANRVDQMQPAGMTNVTIGLAWAWHALTRGAPFTEASAPAEDLDKVIILLTDGDNTESWDNASKAEVTSRSAIDARTRLACQNIKAAGIKLYTIRVIDGNATLLRDCASSPSMYYDVQQASQLNAVFKQIATNLASLRVSK